MKLMQYISLPYCKRNVISYLLDNCENVVSETEVLNCTVFFTLPSRTDENRATRLHRRQENCAVNVQNGDASVFTSVLLPLGHFSFSLFVWKTKRKKLFAWLQHVKNKHNLCSWLNWLLIVKVYCLDLCQQ